MPFFVYFLLVSEQILSLLHASWFSGPGLFSIMIGVQQLDSTFTVALRKEFQDILSAHFLACLKLVQI